jgi:hypothetical protein
MILLASPVVNAKTTWEAYLNLPNQENARKVVSIEYSEGAIPKDYGYWAPDLKILKVQVLAGDGEAFQLTYRLMRSSDGGLLEELISILASSIRPQPELFLEQMKSLNPSERVLAGILNMSGLEYVDRKYAQEYEHLQRRSAISSVRLASLKAIKEECLRILAKNT